MIFHVGSLRTPPKQPDVDVPWPPFRVYVYPNTSRHSTDCLYPPEMPNRYINETNFWFQRMLEPTVHHQMLSSPIVTDKIEEADVFYVPHYSRMCSGLDNGQRWGEIPAWLREYGEYLTRYSSIDHFIMHSVPNYGDKPADVAIWTDKAPMIGVLDFKWDKYIAAPWTFAKSMVMPFITIASKANAAKSRYYKVFIAMATKRLAGKSARLRQQIEKELPKVPKTKYVKINRGSIHSFQKALKALPVYMSDSELCIIPPGDAPSSKRLYDAINHLCVPLLLSDHFTLPFDGVMVDYEKAFTQLPAASVENISETINGYSKKECQVLRNELEMIKERFTWNYKEPAVAGQGLWTTAWAMYDKHRMIKPYLNNEMTGFDSDPEFYFVN